MKWMRTFGLAMLCVIIAAPKAAAQNGWDFSVYPILAWVPLGIDIDVDVPPFEGGDGGAGEIIEGRFDGAFLGGVSATNGTWRIDADVIWAGVGGDRIDRPQLTVDADIVYAHGLVGYKVANNVFVGG